MAFNQYSYLPIVYEAITGASGRMVNESWENEVGLDREVRSSVKSQLLEGASSFDPNGYLYVPPNCESPDVQCKLHVVFHGTFMGA